MRLRTGPATTSSGRTASLLQSAANIWRHCADTPQFTETARWPDIHFVRKRFVQRLALCVSTGFVTGEVAYAVLGVRIVALGVALLCSRSAGSLVDLLHYRSDLVFVHRFSPSVVSAYQSHFPSSQGRNHGKRRLPINLKGEFPGRVNLVVNCRPRR